MCVLFIAWQVHPDYPLVIAANRDEYFARSTAPLSQWRELPIAAGRDLEAGGTWFGMSTSGRIAGVTNVRRPDLVKPHQSSRGELPVKYLADTLTDAAFQTWLSTHHQHYNPFNLLFGTVNQLWVFNSLSTRIEPLTQGFYSISNGVLEDIWPKMARGTQALTNYIKNIKSLDTEELMELLHDSTRAPIEQLPNTGVASSLEYWLSSIFIPPAAFPNGLYGTRSSTVLLCGKSAFQAIEYTYNSDGLVTNSAQLSITIPTIL
ncbi:MAG: hypothetical protein RLZZ422_263 [Pseudomonadota bacterium]|jgi:uncharacterized protein with NRDE domain